MFWVQERLDGRQLPGLPTIKRHQLASGCLHVAVEHSQAIIVLVEEKLFASALALVRPLFESYLRGTWLLNAATDAQIDDAGRDRFPSAGMMVDGLEKVGLSLTDVKKQWWNTLCSYTHTGYQQIGARLTSEGLRSNYKDEEVEMALKMSSNFSLVTVMQFAALAKDESLARTALERITSPGGRASGGVRTTAVTRRCCASSSISSRRAWASASSMDFMTRLCRVPALRSVRDGS